MSYESVDALQRALTQNVFHYAQDAKKAAGRALGTLVEIMTFYLLKSWDLESHTSIERRLPEYGNPKITHNVEFCLHPSRQIEVLQFGQSDLPLTPRKIMRAMTERGLPDSEVKSTQLLTKQLILRNACVVEESSSFVRMAYLSEADTDDLKVSIFELDEHPFAVVECKRVGVEEGVKKGPQTIEKAKQGAYVARAVSALQKIRMSDGSVLGVIEGTDGGLLAKPYTEFLSEIVDCNNPDLLRHFILTVGVVSNHGNWFTSEDHNKELKVLAQSYDWLLFLSDAGLSQFVETLIDKPSEKYMAIRDAFEKSYTGNKGKNTFTKVKIDLSADLALQRYFRENTREIESWFETISPVDRDIQLLKKELQLLSSKDWRAILT